MPNSDPSAGLGKRERQIMNLLYAKGRASVAEILASLPDPPSYSSVRGMLRYLEDKGRVRHEQDGPRYVYLPIVAKASARRSALGHLLNTFFDDSVTSVVATLLESHSLTREEYERLSKLVDSAFREKGAK